MSPTTLSNLSIHTPYHGFHDIVISGMGLPITHTGSTSLSASSHIFYLNDVLCIPTMKKKIIYIS